MQNLTDKNFWIDKVLPSITEYGIYLLVMFLFTDKGESFRTIGLYIPPIALIIRSYLVRQKPFDWNDPLFLSISALCFSAIVSSLMANDPLLSMSEVKKTYLKIFLMFIVIKATFGVTTPVRRIVVLLSVLSVFFIAMTYYDYVTKAIANDGRILYDFVRKYNSILAYLLPFIPYVVINTKNKSRKLLWILALSLGLAALLLTGFRGGWVSISVSMLIWSIWSLRIKWSKAFLLIVGGTIITISIILTLLPSSHIKTRLQSGFSTTHRSEWGWKGYAQIYYEFPIMNKILGKGLSKEEMYTAFDEWYRQDKGDYPTQDIPPNPHNLYLSILFKQGLLGFILYINLIVVTLTTMINAIKKNRILEDRAMGIAILCPFIGEFLVHSLVEDMRLMPLGLILGLVGAYSNLTETNSCKGKDDGYLSNP